MQGDMRKEEETMLYWRDEARVLKIHIFADECVVNMCFLSNYYSYSDGQCNF